MDDKFQAAAAALSRGQRHEAAGEFKVALDRYDAALSLLAFARTATTLEPRRQLAVAWMNRGNALQKLAAATGPHERPPAELRAAAVTAFDEAISLLRDLPGDAAPTVRNHLGAAWLNRGHALLAADAPAAAASLEIATSIFTSLPLDADPHYRLNLAGARTNLAHLLLESDPARARTLAREVHSLLAGEVRTHPRFAEACLRATHVIAREACLPGSPTPLADVTDAIEDGLALARDWAASHATLLLPLAAVLFHLGTELYRAHQPYFLAEFVLEHATIGPFATDASFRMTATTAVWLALQELEKPKLLMVGDVASARHVAAVRSLRAALLQLSTPASSTPTSAA